MYCWKICYKLRSKRGPRGGGPRPGSLDYSGGLRWLRSHPELCKDSQWAILSFTPGWDAGAGICAKETALLIKSWGPLSCSLDSDAISIAEAALSLHLLRLRERHGNGEIRHAGKKPTSRLKTGRAGRLLAYRKTGPSQAGNGLGSAPAPPPCQPCSLVPSTVSLPGLRPSFLLSPGHAAKRRLAWLGPPSRPLRLSLQLGGLKVQGSEAQACLGAHAHGR